MLFEKFKIVAQNISLIKNIVETRNCHLHIADDYDELERLEFMIISKLRYQTFKIYYEVLLDKDASEFLTNSVNEIIDKLKERECLK